MIRFFPSDSSWDDDKASDAVWTSVKAKLEGDEVLCFYKHPLLNLTRGVVPELVMVTKKRGGIAIGVRSWQIEEIEAVEADDWKVKAETVSNPILDIEDFKYALDARFKKERLLRNKVSVSARVALPLISKSEFVAKFGESEIVNGLLFRGAENLDEPPVEGLNADTWRIAQSVFQGANVLSQGVSTSRSRVTDIGEAVRTLEKEIALFDDTQVQVAIQIPPGPQMIRGLAGTGKTALLAMKAASIHSKFPNKRILFTFHTQSLYNQARQLITKFYRLNMDRDPDWDMVHVRHSWGGKYKPGVYFDLCSRQGATALDFRSARNRDGNVPFAACCKDAVSRPIEPFYDYVLIDEAQDLPQDFFRIAYRMTFPPHPIYYAFDELQSLTSVELPTSQDLFGVDGENKPLIDMNGEYPGPIEKILILEKSYRCPLPILMLAQYPSRLTHVDSDRAFVR